MTGTFEGGKISVGQILSDQFTFNIPDYQRPFVWGRDEFDILFEDLKESAIERDPSYFLGAVVLHAHYIHPTTRAGLYDVVDGQQRIITLLILLAVIRDILWENGSAEDAGEVQAHIYRKANQRLGLEEQVRLTVWPEERGFFKDHVLTLGGTRSLPQGGLGTEGQKRMAEAISLFRDKCNDLIASNGSLQPIYNIYKHLRDSCYLLYTITDNKALALTQFIRLNARGVDLQSSDLLKTQNLDEITNDIQRSSCAQIWTRLENDLGRERMELLLGFIRDIKLKQKARKTLWEEYQLIFSKGHIHRGAGFFDVVQRMGDIYSRYVLYPLSARPRTRRSGTKTSLGSCGISSLRPTGFRCC